MSPLNNNVAVYSKFDANPTETAASLEALRSVLSGTSFQ